MNRFEVFHNSLRQGGNSGLRTRGILGIRFVFEGLLGSLSYFSHSWDYFRTLGTPGIPIVLEVYSCLTRNLLNGFFYIRRYPAISALVVEMLESFMPDDYLRRTRSNQCR